MKWKILRMWLLLSEVIMLAVLVIVIVYFGDIYWRTNFEKRPDFGLTNITDVAGSQKQLLIKKLDEIIKTPMVIFFSGGQVTINELEINDNIQINIEGKTAVYDANSHPIVFFREDLLGDKKTDVEEIKIYRRYYVTIKSESRELVIGSLDQKESKLNNVVYN